jgi:hypothetical protein
MTTDWLVNSNFGRICRIFGTAVDSANSNFGWSSLGKPADDGDSAPAGVAEGAPLLPARTRSGRAVLKDLQDLLLLSGPCGIRCGAHLRKARSVLLQPLLLAGARERELRLLGLGGVHSLRPHCGSRAGGGTAGPAGPPGVSGPSVRPGKSLAFCL